MRAAVFGRDRDGGQRTGGASLANRSRFPGAQRLTTRRQPCVLLTASTAIAADRTARTCEQLAPLRQRPLSMASRDESKHDQDRRGLRRVSSDRQTERETIASQTAAVREHASERGSGVQYEWVFEDDLISRERTERATPIANGIGTELGPSARALLAGSARCPRKAGICRASGPAADCLVLATAVPLV